MSDVGMFLGESYVPQSPNRSLIFNFGDYFSQRDAAPFLVNQHHSCN